MIICKKCKTQLEDGTKFCYVCGTEVTSVMTCPGCGRAVDEKAAFCENCGTPLADHKSISASIPAAPPEPEKMNPMPPVQAAAPTSMPSPESIRMPVPGPTPMPMPVPMPGTAPVPAGKVKPAKTGKPKRLLPKILIAVAALAAVVIIAVLVPKLFKSDKSVNVALYLKDGELNYASLSSVKPKEITDALDKGGTIETDSADYLGYTIAFSSDGKRLFYPDRISDSDDGMTIYYQDINSKKSEGKKIDSEISLYKVNDAGNKIFYIKGDDSELYVSDLKNSEKLDSDVSTFYVNSSGSRLIYINNDGNIYEKDGKKDTVKIDSNSMIVTISDNMDAVYYLKSNSLYVKKEGKAKEKLLSEVTSVINIYDTGEIYYLKESDISYNLADFLNDDLAESDAAMAEPTEPLYPDYNNFSPNIDYPVEPDYYDYTDSWGYIDWDLYDSLYNEYYAAVDEYNALWDENYAAALEAYNQAYDVYLGACDEYSAKQNRDSIRSSIQGVTIPVTNFILYYYDTKESTAVSDVYSSYYGYSSEKPVIIYFNNNKAEISKINMSEITSYDDLFTRASNTVGSSSDAYTAVNGEGCILKKSTSSYYLTEAGDAIYYMDNYNSDADSGDLYEIQITDNKLGTPSKIDDNIYNLELLYGTDDLVYYKNVKDSSGDLYLNGKLVDTDVSTYSSYAIDNSDSIIYYTNYDFDKGIGTLKIFDGKEARKIGDDIHSYCAISNNRILYLMDYNIDRAKGDLYLYNGSDQKKEIDTDVTALIPVYSSGYRGDYSYFWE